MKTYFRRAFPLTVSLALAASLLLSCGTSKPEELTYLLIDRTGAWQAREYHRFMRTLAFFQRLCTEKGGQHIVVASINHSSSNVRELMSLDSPAFDPVRDNSDFQKEKQQQDFADRLESGLKNIYREMQKPASGETSPLMEALTNLVDHIRQTKYKHVTLVLFSDMVQNSESIDFSKPPASKGDITATVARAKALHLVPDMHGFNVHVFGVGNFDFHDDRRLPYRLRKHLKSRNDDFIRRNEAIWRAYFKDASASLKAYAPQPL